MEKSTEVLLCYRGRFNKFVTALAEELRKLGVRVTYDCEILADSSGFNEESEIEWHTLVGGESQDDTTWRAPLRAAVDSSEMVTFALDLQDRSENVQNEFRWALQTKAHTFFLIHGDITDLEAQSFFVGSLQAEYMFTTDCPKIPEFGFHFCGNLDDAELKKDVIVAAHRIVAHLARCRQGELPELTGDNDIKMSDVEKRPDVRGRHRLHRLQKAVFHGADPPSLKPAYEAASEYLHEKEVQASRTARTDRLIKLFQRAENILGRSRPGPHELSHYIGSLVLQAAYIEAMIHDDLRKVQSALDFRPIVLIGTIPFSTLGEAWTILSDDGYSIIIIDAMFLDFMYQSIKVSVSSAKATLHNQGGRRIVELDFGALPEQLRTKPELLEGFYKCIRRYIVDGRPDSSTIGSPAQEIQKALGTYIRMAERYLLGLGYAQITVTGDVWPWPALDLDFDPKDATPEQRRTLLDVMALDYNVRGRSFIDKRDPLDAMAGCLFALSAIHVRQRMLTILDPNSTKWGYETPEGFKDRLQQLKQYFYHQMISGGATEAFATQVLERAWLTGTTPLQLWTHIEPRLCAELQQGLKPTPAWGANYN